MNEVPSSPRRRFVTFGAIGLCALVLALGARSTAADGYVAPEIAPGAWLEQLEQADRAPLQGWITFLPPEFSESLRWVGPNGDSADEPDSWRSYHGKVVVLQSWSVADERSRERLEKVAEVTGRYSDIDVQLIALHTPDGHENAAAYIRESGDDRAPRTVIDATGEFCDALGVYRTPVNVIVGRNGAIRYAGLTPDGVAAAIEALIDEDPTAAPCAGTRLIQHGVVAAPAVDFPPPNPTPRARNLMGNRGPEFQVEQWITREPAQIGGNVTVIEFMSTGCPHCMNAIPHMNSLQNHFGDRVTVVAVSNETPSRFEQGLARRNLSPTSFTHAVALDRSNRIGQAVQPQGIPNAVVLDSNWIVRWQGHPSQLTVPLLGQIVSADEARRGASPPPPRWRAELTGEELEGVASETRSAPPTRLERAPVDRERLQRERAASARQAAEREQPAEPGPAVFPPTTGGDIGGAAEDLRGKPGPDFFVQSWVNGVPKDMDDPVIVIEFFATWCPHCRNAFPHLNDLVRQFEDRVSLIAISNEQKDAFEQGVARHAIDLASLEFPIALDPSDRMKNALRPRGVPYAMVLTSDWIVRWQGHPSRLTASLLDQIIRADDVRRAEAPADPQPEEEVVVLAAPEPPAPVDFPPITGDTRAGVDLRGKPGPDFRVDTWITAAPLQVGGRVTVVEFFATWCPHCRNAIPKLNQWNTRFGDRVSVIAISDETPEKFAEGVERHNISQRSFNHFVGLDPASYMKNAFQPRGVPFAAVLCSNWVVRWQGHPNNLTPELLEQIVRADESSRMSAAR